MTLTTNCQKSMNNTPQTWRTWWRHLGRRLTRSKVQVQPRSTPSPSPGSSGWQTWCRILPATQRFLPVWAEMWQNLYWRKPFIWKYNQGWYLIFCWIVTPFPLSNSDRQLLMFIYVCRKVFKQREAFERMINENEDKTTKVNATFVRLIF